MSKTVPAFDAPEAIVTSQIGEALTYDTEKRQLRS